jgi:hypothetical protein
VISIYARKGRLTVQFHRCALGGVRSHFGTDGADAHVWKAYNRVKAGKIEKAVKALEKGGYDVEVTQ